MPPDGSGRIYSATYSNVPVYKFNVEGNHVMRRRADDWINATHILKVADFDKLARTRILEREVQNGVHEKVQGGYGKYQGTWIPLHEGRVLAERNGVLDKLLPIFDFIPGDRSLPPAPKHATAASSRPKAARRSLGRRAQVAHAAASQVREDHYEGESAQYADAETPDNVTIAVSEREGGRKRKRDADQLSAQDRTHQIWADALLDSQRPPPAKKPKAAKPLGCFPNFDDSDVAISVGDLELKLHSQTLCDTCDYFTELNSTSTKFPERFALKPSSLSLGNDANQTLAFAVVSPTGSDSNDVEAADDDDNSAPRATTPTSDARMKRARAANEAIFRLLYRQPLSCARPTDFRDAAALATRYGCMNKVKDALVSAILKASLGTTLFRDDPWALLNAGYNLRDEAIFSEALLHVVGRGGGGGDELLPSGVADLVDKHLADLEAKVKTCWQDALRCSRTDSIPRAFATTLMRSYVDQHVACALGSPLRPEVYKVLAALHHMANIRPLLHAGLMASVDEVDDALVASQTFINNQDSDRCYDAESYDNTIHILNKGLDQCVNRQSVEGELRSMLQGIKEVIKPLFVGDRNIGYFTCMHFAGPFPWPNTPPSSP